MIGRLVKVNVKKNKVAPPFKKAEFDIMFGEGISRSGEVLDLAVNLGIVKKSGAWFSYEGKKLGQGRDAVKGVIKDNPELMEELDKKVRAKLKELQSQPSESNPFLPKDTKKKGKGADADDVDTDDDNDVDDSEMDVDTDDFGDSGEISDDLFADDFDLEG